MEFLTGFREETKLTLIFVHVDANIFHGWSHVCGIDCVSPLWQEYSAATSG
jgi:hypothetical protein